MRTDRLGDLVSIECGIHNHEPVLERRKRGSLKTVYEERERRRKALLNNTSSALQVSTNYNNNNNSNGNMNLTKCVKKRRKINLC